MDVPVNFEEKRNSIVLIAWEGGRVGDPITIMPTLVQGASSMLLPVLDGTHINLPCDPRI